MKVGIPRFVALLLFALPVVIEGQDPPLMTLGPITGQAERGFTHLIAMRELSDGHLLVTDPGERALYAISFDEGGGIRQIGRRGQGPREYAQPRWLVAIGRDSTLLIDGMRTRWHVLRGAEILEVLTARSPVIEEFGQVVGALDDQLVDVVGVSWAPDAIPGGAITADSVLLRFADRPWEMREGLPPIDTLGFVMTGAGAGGLGGCAVAAGGRNAGDAPTVRLCGDLFPSEDRAVTFDDGWLAVAHLKPYRVSWRSPDGAWSTGPPVSLETVPYTELERCAAAQGWAFRGMGLCEGSDYGMQPPPEEYPPFVRTVGSRRTLGGTPSVLAAPDGRLVVRRTPTARTYMYTRYDVFDRSGARVGRIQFSADQAILGFGAASVYTVRTDELDLQWVRRHDWPPPRPLRNRPPPR